MLLTCVCIFDAVVTIVPDIFHGTFILGLSSPSSSLMTLGTTTPMVSENSRSREWKPLIPVTEFRVWNFSIPSHSPFLGLDLFHSFLVPEFHIYGNQKGIERSGEVLIFEYFCLPITLQFGKGEAFASFSVADELLCQSSKLFPIPKNF